MFNENIWPLIGNISLKLELLIFIANISIKHEL